MASGLKVEREHIAWIDKLRVLACFLVVLAHACDHFVGQFDNDRIAFLTGTAIGSLVRPCVPLFVMVTGVLLLPVADRYRSLTSFYSHRLGRLVWPLIFWSVMLPVMGFCYFNYVNPATESPMLSAEMYTAEALTPRMWSWIFNFNYDSTALWYLYMLVGLYLVIPVIDGWLRTASRSDIRLLLYIWGVSLCLPYIQMAAPLLGYEGVFGNFGLLGVCDWNMFGVFYYVSGFVGYLLLAYYMKTYPLDWSRAKMAAVLIPMFLIGYAVTFGGYVVVQNYHPGDYAYLEVVWLFCGINVFMMTFPAFAFMQRLKGRTPRLVSFLAPLTFGIYLVHFPLENGGYDLYAHSGLPYWARIILSAVTVFIVTAAVVWILRQWRVTRRLVS
ncbi:MAG: acyltransferase [Muribaculaceae bacterium]|nr:acyltransferase [Muribaculaceae bacterium]